MFRHLLPNLQGLSNFVMPSRTSSALVACRKEQPCSKHIPDKNFMQKLRVLAAPLWPGLAAMYAALAAADAEAGGHAAADGNFGITASTPASAAFSNSAREGASCGLGCTPAGPWPSGMSQLAPGFLALRGALADLLLLALAEDSSSEIDGVRTSVVRASFNFGAALFSLRVSFGRRACAFGGGAASSSSATSSSTIVRRGFFLGGAAAGLGSFCLGGFAAANLTAAAAAARARLSASGPSSSSSYSSE